MAQQPTNDVQTIEITNFGGRLTRKLNGDLNSGFAKFASSYGYDPFSKPDNLTWLEAPVDITGNSPSSVTGLMLTAKPRSEGLAPSVQYIYSVDNSGVLYKTQPNSVANPNLDSPSVIGQLVVNSPSFTFGASMEFYQNPSSVAGSYERIYVGSNNGINTVGLDGSGEGYLSGGFAQNTYRPLKQFVGKLLFGNGNTIGAVDSTGSVTSSIIGTGQGNFSSELNPPLSVETNVHDLDVSIDGNYALITGSDITNERIAGTFNNTDTQSSASSNGGVYSWNGSDVTVTALKSIPSYAVTALQTYLGNNVFFSNDSFGSSLNDGTNKILTLPNNKSPLPNAVCANGNFLTWVAPEIEPVYGAMVASLYYFGSLDQENPPGLYRLMRYFSPLGSPTSAFVYQTPLNILTSNKYTSLNAGKTAVTTFGYGKHYLSTWELTSSTSAYKFLRFLVTPTGSGTPQAGIYETQTQLFGKKITIKQIRVYTEPTVSGNQFTLLCMGSDGTVITNGQFSYTYAAGTDITQVQGSLERIDFNPSMKDTYALGIKIANQGSTNMTIKKIEVDYVVSGK